MSSLSVALYTLYILSLLVQLIAASSQISSADETFDSFITNGLHILSGVKHPIHRHDSPTVNAPRSYKKSGCKTLCNGEPLTSTSCVGRTEVICITSDTKNSRSVYIRMCDGSFVNKTREFRSSFETDQACKGVSRLSMVKGMMNTDTGRWESVYDYERSCFTKYAMFVQNKRLKNRLAQVKVTSVCIGASYTKFESTQQPPATQATNKRMNPRPFSGAASVACNSNPTTLYKSCDGVVTASEKSGPMTKGLTCKGQWTAYDNVLFECSGKQSYFENTIVHSTINHMSRNCSGLAATNIVDDGSRGFIICNGEAYFREKFYLNAEAT